MGFAMASCNVMHAILWDLKRSFAKFCNEHGTSNAICGVICLAVGGFVL